MHTTILWVIIATLVIANLICEHTGKNRRGKLRDEIRTLRKEELVWKRAQMNNLLGTETRDLHDLVFRHERNDSERFETLFQSTSKKVRLAFREWEQKDKPKHDTYCAHI